MTTTLEAPSTIGRSVAIVFEDKCYLATVVDLIAGSDLPKRVRIQNDPFLQGKVLFPSQYVFKAWADDE